MSEISRVALFGKLNSVAYKAIEGATVFCKLRGNPYVELAHWIAQIVQAENTDIHCIVRHFEIDASRLSADITAALDKLPRGATAISDLNDPAITGSAAQATVTQGLSDLDKILGNVQSARSEVGEMLNRMDGIEGRLAVSKLAAQTEKSNAEDLDMVEAISQFQNKQTGYEAALQSYASIQKMSLFQYIS